MGRRERPLDPDEGALQWFALELRKLRESAGSSGNTVQFLEARHRPHALVEDHIRCGKQTGLGHLPSASIEINRAWCLAATIVRIVRGQRKHKIPETWPWAEHPLQDQHLNQQADASFA